MKTTKKKIILATTFSLLGMAAIAVPTTLFTTGYFAEASKVYAFDILKNSEVGKRMTPVQLEEAKAKFDFYLEKDSVNHKNLVATLSSTPL